MPLVPAAPRRCPACIAPAAHLRRSSGSSLHSHSLRSGRIFPVTSQIRAPPLAHTVQWGRGSGRPPTSTRHLLSQWPVGWSHLYSSNALAVVLSPPWPATAAINGHHHRSRLHAVLAVVLWLPPSPPLRRRALASVACYGSHQRPVTSATATAIFPPPCSRYTKPTPAVIYGAKPSIPRPRHISAWASRAS